MYKVVKEVGTNENVYLQNTDTMAEINLGRATTTMMDILEKDGYKFSLIHPSDDVSECITLKEKWTLKVSDEVKDELRKLAMPMNKPIRNQRKVKQEEKKSNKEIDAIDVLLGLASYN